MLELVRELAAGSAEPIKSLDVYPQDRTAFRVSSHDCLAPAGGALDVAETVPISAPQVAPGESQANH